jgi:thymidylate synthase
MNLKPIHIKATTLPDAWFSTVYACLEHGKEFVIDSGSYEGEKRLEFDDITVHILKPTIPPLLPEIPVQYNLPNPASDDYLVDYVPYLMTGTKKEGESYTYGQRLCEVDYWDQMPLEKITLGGGIPFDKKIVVNMGNREYWYNKKIIKNSGMVDHNNNQIWYCNQIEHIIWTYKNKGHRNNQMVLQVAQPSDCLLIDPPCLRHIDTRIQDGKLHFFPYFRSWDLWGGFPANLAGIVHLQEYMASEIGVEVGEMIASSKGLHIYKYVWELAEILRGKTIEEFRSGK